MKKLLRILLEIVIIVPLVVLLLPLFYICFLVIFIIVPPVLFGMYFFADRKHKKLLPFNEMSLQFVSILVCLPLILLMITALVRSMLLAAYSFYPAALSIFNDFHNEFIYQYFIPVYGELFPYWLDVYWGIFAVLIIFGLALMDSIRRNRLVRQIEILPTSKVHSAAIGLVELKGKAVPLETDVDEPIILSRMVEKVDNMYDIEAPGEWYIPEGTLYGTEIITEPFMLDDGTGRVLIDPTGCDVGSTDKIFEINLHQILLKPFTPEKGLPESRLMPGDDIYVLGNLRIDNETNNDPDNPDDLGKVIIKPKKSIFDGFGFNDIFFISNISEEELINAFRKAIKRGWKGVLITMAIPAWLTINGWTNMVQLKALELEAAPAFFRLITTATVLERQFGVKGLGRHSTIYWLGRLKQGTAKTDDIMQVLKDQGLEKLAIPVLLTQAKDIDHTAFGVANVWIQKLHVVPEGHWGHEYSRKENIEKYEKNKNTFVSRVLLDNNKNQLQASYRVYFGEVKFKHLELIKRYVVFDMTHKENGLVQHMEFFSNHGWNRVDDIDVFDALSAGEYSFDFYAKRQYRGGRSDKGTWRHKTIDITL